MELRDVGQAEGCGIGQATEVARHIGERLGDGRAGADFTDARQCIPHRSRVGAAPLGPARRKTAGDLRELGGFGLAAAHGGNGCEQRE